MSRADTRSPSLLHHSSRALPAILVALVMLAVGVAAAWAAIERLGAGNWPTWASAGVRSLSGVSWNNPALLAGCAVVAVVGLVLLLAAVLPGARNGTTVTLPGDASGATRSTEAMINRRALARLLTAEADLVDGVDGVTATVSRKRVTLSVDTPSTHRGKLEETVTGRVRGRLDELGLRPMPRITVNARTRTPRG